MPQITRAILFRVALLILLLAALLGFGSNSASAQTQTQLWSASKGDVLLPFVNTKSPTAGVPDLWNNTGQFYIANGTPSIASGACGTAANGTIAGTNQAGVITIGAVATTTCTVSFSATLQNAPRACILFPGNAAAAATGTTVARVGSLTTGGFVVTGSALASTVYNFLCV